MIQHLAASYGPESRNRLDQATDTSPDGARAVLESFYYALNHRDTDAMRGVWTDHSLAQLNNPLGGILRDGTRAVELYARIFAGPARLEIAFTDIVEYVGTDHVVYAGRETGHYSTDDLPMVPVAIRTTRYFRCQDGRLAQYHHHGSIDDPAALTAYQHALS
jgi:hypothetical protein